MGSSQPQLQWPVTHPAIRPSHQVEPGCGPSVHFALPGADLLIHQSFNGKPYPVQQRGSGPIERLPDTLTRWPNRIDAHNAMSGPGQDHPGRQTGHTGTNHHDVCGAAVRLSSGHTTSVAHKFFDLWPQTHASARVSGIPMLETRADDRWGDEEEYRHYTDNTPVLVPRPPGRP